MPRELFTLSDEAYGLLSQAFAQPQAYASPMAAFAKASVAAPESTPDFAPEPAPSA